MNARTEAAAREGQMIDQSQQRAIAARQAEQSKPRTAIEILASRLDVSPSSLQTTLKNTVFKGCSDSEFVALCIVSNTYDLNPITREIYAFPKKGGGIQPMIAYDGWVKIMNNHPQFDGIEYEHIEDGSGNLKAIEVSIWRKDRTRPVKKMVYLKEFKRNTEPWNNSPHHMLDVRGTCHAVRLAFGVSAGVEGEDDAIDGGVIVPQSMPSKQSIGEQLGDAIPTFDGETGEIIDEQKPAKTASKPAPAGMTEVSEEVARELDNRNDGTLSDDNSTAGEGPADEQRGEAYVDQRAAAEQTAQDIDGPLEQEKQAAPAKKPFEWQDNVDFLKEKAGNCGSMEELKLVEGDYLRVCGSWPKEICDDFERFLTTHRNRIRGEG